MSAVLGCCYLVRGRAKKFRLLLARFLDLERPLVTTRMLAFLRQVRVVVIWHL